MITFLIGLSILILGAVVYGRICERMMRPKDTPTPAKRLKKWHGLRAYEQVEE